MLDTSKIYETKFNGSLKIVEYINNKNVTVEFIDTGYQTAATTKELKTGLIKDHLKPNVHDVGFIGVGDYKCRQNGLVTKAYKIWNGMIKRCYCKDAQARRPTYKGCSVDPIWHNFQNFAKWFEVNYIEGYVIDKDIIKEGNKVYSPEFCKFVSPYENNEKAHAKHYEFISPKGIVTKIYNMAKFCRDNDLHKPSMYKVNLGQRKQHQDWRLFLQDKNK